MSFRHILVKNPNSKDKEKDPKCFQGVGGDRPLGPERPAPSPRLPKTHRGQDGVRRPPLGLCSQLVRAGGAAGGFCFSQVRPSLESSSQLSSRIKSHLFKNKFPQGPLHCTTATESGTQGLNVLHMSAACGFCRHAHAPDLSQPGALGRPWGLEVPCPAAWASGPQGRPGATRKRVP